MQLQAAPDSRFETAEVVIPYAALPLYEDRLAEVAESCSSFEVGAAPDPTTPAVEWAFQLLFASPPDRSEIERLLSETAIDAGIGGRLPAREHATGHRQLSLHETLLCAQIPRLQLPPTRQQQSGRNPAFRPTPHLRPAVSLHRRPLPPRRPLPHRRHLARQPRQAAQALCHRRPRQLAAEDKKP